MQVAAPSLFNVTSQLQLQAARSGQSKQVSNVQRRLPSEEDITARRTDPKVPKTLSELSELHSALVSAWNTNNQMEKLYLFDTLR
jgi:hypothetical protein